MAPRADRTEQPEALGTLYSSCSFTPASPARSGDLGKVVSVDLYQRDPAAPGDWEVDHVWRVNLASIVNGALPFQTVSAVGDGAIWRPSAW